MFKKKQVGTAYETTTIALSQCLKISTNSQNDDDHNNHIIIDHFNKKEVMMSSNITTTFASSSQQLPYNNNNNNNMEVINNKNNNNNNQISSSSSSSSSSLWVYGLINSHLKSPPNLYNNYSKYSTPPKYPIISSSSSSNDHQPHLELTLASPMASNLELEQNKNPPTISVT